LVVVACCGGWQWWWLNTQFIQPQTTIERMEHFTLTSKRYHYGGSWEPVLVNLSFRELERELQLQENEREREERELKVREGELKLRERELKLRERELQLRERELRLMEGGGALASQDQSQEKNDEEEEEGFVDIKGADVAMKELNLVDKVEVEDVELPKEGPKINDPNGALFQ
jgi:hypothetical protein